jgi:hypothetical protein
MFSNLLSKAGLEPAINAKEIIHEAHENIIDQLSLLFQSKTEELTNYQINLLKALLKV